MNPASAGGDVGISVVVPSVRAGSITDTIESIRAQSRPDWELIVVAQGEDLELRAQLDAAEARDARVRSLWIPSRGVSRARNAGIAAATGDVIALTDDDCEAEPDWLERLLAAFDEALTVGFVAGSLIAPPDVGGRFERCPESVPDDFTLRPESDGQMLPPGARLVSANLAFRRSAIERMGPFDVELGAGMSFGGGEDLDLLVRAVHAGIPIRFAPDARVHHTSGTRSGLKAVIDLGSAYASGQGAVAAKLTMQTGEEDPWRRSMWEQCLWDPLRSLHWHRLPSGVLRLLAFDRAYRRCLREFEIDETPLLVKPQA